LNSLNTTVVTSESKDIGLCTCDLTPNTCDYLCCCDTDCPTEMSNAWLNNPADVCLNKSKTFK
jgi:hypothetical protein